MAEAQKISPSDGPSMTEQLLIAQGEIEAVPQETEAVAESRIRGDVFSMVASLFVAGTSTKSIAATLRLTEDKVRAILKQPEIQPHIQEAIRAVGKDACANLLEATKAENIWTLIELRNDAATPANVKANVCIKLIELSQGKEPIKPNSDKAQRQEAIIDRMTRLEAQLADLKS